MHPDSMTYADGYSDGFHDGQQDILEEFFENIEAGEFHSFKEWAEKKYEEIRNL